MLSQYDFVQYQTLDIEQDPIAQGFEPQGYDLVLATNVLHATTDLHETANRVRTLLAPEGFLFAVEGTRKQRFADIIVGLTPGWWAFSDNDLRPSYALLSQSKWLNLFEEADFASAQGITGQEALSNQSLLVAQAKPSLSVNAAGKWLLFTKNNTLGTSLAEKLRGQNQTVQFVNAGNKFAQKKNGYQIVAGRVNDFHKLIQANDDLKGIVYLWGMDHHSSSVEAQAVLCGGLLYLVQALVASGKPCPVWVVTRGAQSANGKVTAPHQATLWGLRKVINQEHPELSCRIVDVDPNQFTTDDKILDHLWMEISASDSEDQVAYRDNERLLPQLVNARAGGKASMQPEPVKLTIGERGVLDHLAYQKLTRKSPGSGEVEIQVIATGIGFRDVLNTLGMYPGGGELGSECAGVITAVGPDVENFQVGDSVIAFALGCFATYVITPSRFVVLKPAHLTYLEAATIPSAFLTSQYTLHHLAKMKAGDHVLIHAASGGVGLAAVQLAQRVGAEIFGTAGSPAKRELLKSLGVQHVMDSRTLDFADEIMQLTDGKGVDIVLNSLADEFIPKSISVLAEKGRFIELGKRSIWSEEQFAEVKPKAYYKAVDLLLEGTQNEELIPSLFQRIMFGFEDSSLKPLPLRVYPASEVMDAFRYMAQARHTGKLVILQEVAPFAIREEATYLITGGLGGLGLAVASWLAELGAKYIALIGRSVPREQARATLQKLTDTGVDVRVIQADVADREAMSEAFAQIKTSMPPMKGVVHAAGLLDDGVLSQQTWERFSTVFAPKVQGG